MYDFEEIRKEDPEIAEAIQAEMARQAKEEVRKEKREEAKAQLEENEEILRHGFSK